MQITPEDSSAAVDLLPGKAPLASQTLEGEGLGLWAGLLRLGGPFSSLGGGVFTILFVYSAPQRAVPQLILDPLPLLVTLRLRGILCVCEGEQICSLRVS